MTVRQLTELLLAIPEDKKDLPIYYADFYEDCEVRKLHYEKDRSWMLS